MLAGDHHCRVEILDWKLVNFWSFCESEDGDFLPQSLPNSIDALPPLACIWHLRFKTDQVWGFVCGCKFRVDQKACFRISWWALCVSNFGFSGANLVQQACFNDSTFMSQKVPMAQLTITTSRGSKCVTAMFGHSRGPRGHGHPWRHQGPA